MQTDLSHLKFSIFEIPEKQHFLPDMSFNILMFKPKVLKFDKNIFNSANYWMGKGLR